MSTASSAAAPWAEAPRGGRGDACPGSLRLHAAEDGALARIRIPGGVLTSPQTRALAQAAEQLADGELHLTSRGNVQLRGLAAESGPELAAILTPAGLLPSPRHERVRNLVASPLAGLDGRGYADVRPWLRELDRLLCAGDATSELSGRFLFALDDGRGDVAALAPDVTLVAAPDDTALLRVGADEAAIAVSAETAPRAALLTAEVFLDDVRSGGRAAWRIDELPGTATELAWKVTRRLAQRGLHARYPVALPAGTGTTQRPEPGTVAGPDDRLALSVGVPLGRLTLRQWLRLTAVADRDGSGEVRLTPWRGAIVPGLPPDSASRAMTRLAADGLITAADSPWRNVGACIGRPGCGKSLADVRADAASALGPGDGPPVYWSGCERRCGRPKGGTVDMVATGEGYDVFVNGERLRTNVPADSSLASAVAAARTRATGSNE